MNCVSLTATHLTFPLPGENLEFYLIQEQQTAQGQTKRQISVMCNAPCCFMETLVSSIADYPFSPTRVTLSFILGIHVVNIYMYIPTNIYGMNGALKS